MTILLRKLSRSEKLSIMRGIEANAISDSENLKLRAKPFPIFKMVMTVLWDYIFLNEPELIEEDGRFELFLNKLMACFSNVMFKMCPFLNDCVKEDNPHNFAHPREAIEFIANSMGWKNHPEGEDSTLEEIILEGFEGISIPLSWLYFVNEVDSVIGEHLANYNNKRSYL